MTGPARFDALNYSLPAIADGRVPTLGPLPAAAVPPLCEAIVAMDPWRKYPFPPDAFCRMLTADEPGAPRLAISLEGEIVGVCVIRAAWLRGPYLQFLALLPKVHNRGVGGAFLAWLEGEARRAEERNLWVAASAINTGAIRFYERAGFTKVADLDELVCDGYMEFLFRKRLT
ncbi:MAG TPA: GNAT family N-acetyltransferase [Hyphomicrobium sp.]|nr:GNAT family N-acetyltransferase [Hyphomicrobium sp.]